VTQGRNGHDKEKEDRVKITTRKVILHVPRTEAGKTKGGDDPKSRDKGKKE
jgi:hypothetical protein